MAQLQIKDATGAQQLVAKVINTGRTDHTDSMPVTLANEDFASLQSINSKTPALVSGAVPTTDSQGGTRTLDNTGQSISPDACTHAYGYNASGLLVTDTATTGGVTWVKTYSYTSGNLTGETNWVRQ